MIPDTELAGYASALTQDMHLCSKYGMFKGYINWFMLSYSRAVEARKQTDNFRRMVTVNKTANVGMSAGMIHMSGYKDALTPNELEQMLSKYI